MQLFKCQTINHLLTYLLTYLLNYSQNSVICYFRLSTLIILYIWLLGSSTYHMIYDMSLIKSYDIAGYSVPLIVIDIARSWAAPISTHEDC